MLIIIHNLPLQFRYNDIKSLINSKCGVKDVILDNLLPDGGGKKVTVGVADEGDAAMLVRSLNGVYLQDSQLFVEVIRQKYAQDQPYRNTSSNVGNNTSDMKNNQHQAIPPPGDMSQIYHNPSIQQMMASQYMTAQMMTSQMGPPPMGPPEMGAPQMVPPPMKEDNFKSTTSMNLNYMTPQTSQLGFGLQQQYSNTNMVPALISYPMKQNLDYGFGMGNQQYSNQGQSQSWGNYDANNSFNTSGQNDYASYSSSNQSRFEQTLPQSKVDTRIRADTRARTDSRGREDARVRADERPGYKRKRSESPDRRQSYSRQGGSDRSNRSQTSSRRHDSSYNDRVPSRSFNRYSPNAGYSSRRDEPPADRIISPWNLPPPLLSMGNQRDVPKSDFSNRNSGYNDAKRFKWSNKDKAVNSTPLNRAYTPKKQIKADAKSSNTKPTNCVPTKKVLENDRFIRNQATKAITKEIFYNSTLIKTKDYVPDGHIYDRMLKAVKARVVLLTDSLYDLNREYCFKVYRDKFPESDDQHFYNVIVNRCKRLVSQQEQTEMPSNEQKSNDTPANSNSAEVTVDKSKLQDDDPSKLLEKPQKEALNVKPSTSASEVKADRANSGPRVAQPTGNKLKIQVPTPGSLPKYPQGNKSVFKENKREAKLQFEEGPSAISGDPVIKKAVENEMYIIETSLLQVLYQESLQTADSDEKVFLELFENRDVGRKINEALQVHVLRRLIDTKVKPVIRVTAHPKLPKKDSLTNFLKGYGILNLKKSDRGFYYIATCQSYKTFDELCSMTKVVIDGMEVNFKPMHLGGPPDKRAMRNKKLTAEFNKEYKNVKNKLATESNAPGNANILEETDDIDEQVSSNLPDDTECKEVVDTPNDDHVKAEDIKHDEQKLDCKEAVDIEDHVKSEDVKRDEQKSDCKEAVDIEDPVRADDIKHEVVSTEKLEKEDERPKENKEDNVAIQEVVDSGVKDESDWPIEGDGEDWTEDIDTKKVQGDVEHENNAEKDTECERELNQQDETFITKSNDNCGNKGPVDDNEVGDLNIGDMDDDDLEDY